MAFVPDPGASNAERSQEFRDGGAVIEPIQRSSAGSPSPQLEAALRYANMGFKVFPCRHKDDDRWKAKEPLTSHGFKDASFDEDRIRTWWCRWPDAMIGLPTGADAGLWVLDLDIGEGKDGRSDLAALEKEHGAIDVQVISQTPSGGLHLFFRWNADRPVKNTASKIGPGIDTRGDGGFVVVAPSAREDVGRYRWIGEELGEGDLSDAPDWLLDLLDKPKGQVREPPAATEDAPPPPSGSIAAAPDPCADRKRSYALAALDREAAAVATTAEGGRNARLNSASYAVANFAGEGWLSDEEISEALAPAALQAGLDPKEVRKTIASGIKAGRAKPVRWPPEWAEEHTEIQRLKALNAALVNGAALAPAAWDAPNVAVLGGARYPVPCFKVEWLGPHLACWVEAQARSACAPADYVACSLLALSGGLLSNRRRPLAGAGWEECSTLFVALVGDPSSGKSPASSAVMNLLNAEEARLDADYRERLRAYETERAAADATLAAYKRAMNDATRADPEFAKEFPPKLPDDFREPVKPFLRRIIVRDSTVERLASLSAENPTGLILHRDELAGLMASFNRYSNGSGGSDRQFFLECFGGRAFTVDRVKSGDPIRIPHLSIGIVGAIQPGKAAELLKGPDDGFISRFLWCWPDPVPGFRIARERLDLSPAERVVNRLWGLHMQSHPVPQLDSPVLVPLEEGALVQLERFAQEMKEREAQASSLMKSALGKARGHALRLACILTYTWWGADPHAPCEEPDAIAEAAMATAIEMMETYFLPMAIRVFGDAAVPIVETNAAILARHLRDEKLKSFNASKLRYKLGGPLREASAMDAACAELEDAGLIQAVDAVRKRGRPSKDYIVNPRLFQRQRGDG